MLDQKLLAILACSLCKAQLEYKVKDNELICAKCKLAYPIDDGIPVMLVEQARDFSQNDSL